MQLHKLKIQHKYLEDIRAGLKTFELRKNDRNYQVGDLIDFIDIDNPDQEEANKNKDANQNKDATEISLPPLAVAFGGSTNNITISFLYEITYILKDVPEYGLDYDYCIFGIRKVKLIREG